MYASPGSAPIAARSESAVASARRPIASSGVDGRRKWTPSTIASTEVAVTPPGAVTAASSPAPSRTGGFAAGRRARSAAMRSNSPITHHCEPGATILAPELERATPLLHRIGEAGATLGKRPPRRRAVRVALQAGLALVIFGFLVLTVAQQWGELQDKGVRFDLIWLLPGFGGADGLLS